MGAWSHEPFGNDTATDWAYELEDCPDLSHIERALDRVLQCGDEYLEATEAEEAVAAVEVIAQLLGRPTQTDAYTEKVKEWAGQTSAKPNEALKGKARQVLTRVAGDNSELQELWSESDDAESWLTSLQRLRDALEA